jgi:hypothetical protein
MGVGCISAYKYIYRTCFDISLWYFVVSMVDDMRGNAAEEDGMSSGMARLPPILW